MGEDFTILISINQTSEIIPSNMFLLYMFSQLENR